MNFNKLKASKETFIDTIEKSKWKNFLRQTYLYLSWNAQFQIKKNELSTRLDKWLYFTWHLEDFQTIPAIFKDDVFTRAFEKAELARFGRAELDSYENSLKIYRDLKGVIETAYDDGKPESKIETASRMK